jgi:hypothetical protein
VGALGDPTRTLERRRAAAAFARQYSWDNHKLDLYAVIDGREPARDAHRS